jgi:hypothetical protein
METLANPLHQDIQPDFATFNPSAPSIEDPETKTRYYLTLPPPEPRDLALGRAIDVFGNVEEALYYCLDRLLGLQTRFEARDIFYNLLDSHKLRETIANVSSLRLDTAQHEDLDRLLDRARDTATKQNRIVHGKWVPCYETTSPPFTVFAYWLRQYRPTNPKERGELAQRPPVLKTYNKYSFRIKRLHEISDETLILHGDIWTFMSSLDGQLPKQLPPPLPQLVAKLSPGKKPSDPQGGHPEKNEARESPPKSSRAKPRKLSSAQKRAVAAEGNDPKP